MKYESIEKAIADNQKRTLYITRNVEAPCGPCWIGEDHEVFALYSTEKEALEELESIYNQHRRDSANYIMEVVKGVVDVDGNIKINQEPIRELPDDKYWQDHGDEFDYDRECWK